MLRNECKDHSRYESKVKLTFINKLKGNGFCKAGDIRPLSPNPMHMWALKYNISLAELGKEVATQLNELHLLNQELDN